MLSYQGGSEEAFKVLYLRHSERIYGFILKKVRSPEVAKDMFQEVFIKLHKSKHLYNASLPALPWIFTITSNTLIDYFRKTKKANITEDIEPDLLPADQVDNTAKDTITDLIAELPVAQREVLEMRYLNDHSFSEIAQKLNTSEGNVRKIISRTIGLLKKKGFDHGK